MIKVFQMFSQTVVKFFLRQAIFFIRLYIAKPKRHFLCSSPIFDSLVQVKNVTILHDGTVPPVICENCSKDKPDAKPFLQGLTEAGSLMLSVLSSIQF